MRRVKNHSVNSSNPGLMFARGVESMVNDHLYHPGRYDQQEIRQQQRASNKQESRGNPFIVLMRQFANF
jgi:hypothetical protein